MFSTSETFESLQALVALGPVSFVSDGSLEASDSRSGNTVSQVSTYAARVSKKGELLARWAGAV